MFGDLVYLNPALNYFPLDLQNRKLMHMLKVFENYSLITVSDPDKGACADPADGGAILGRGEPDPHSENRERQLAPDKGRGKT